MDLCILFQHHNADQATRAHLELIRQFNPGVPVIPIGKLCDERFHDTIDVLDYEGLWTIGRDRKDIWMSGDAIFFRWFEKFRKIEAERYVIFEWDTFTSMSVRAFYDKVWDCDLAGSRIINREDDWIWWKQLRTAAVPSVEKAKGLVPFCGTMISRRVAEALVDTPNYFEGAISELRLATLASIHGFEIGQLCKREEDWNSFPLHAEHRYTDEFCEQRSGIYHRVKYFYPGLQGKLLKEIDR